MMFRKEPDADEKHKRSKKRSRFEAGMDDGVDQKIDQKHLKIVPMDTGMNLSLSQLTLSNKNRAMHSIIHNKNLFN